MQNTQGETWRGSSAWLLWLVHIFHIFGSILSHVEQHLRGSSTVAVLFVVVLNYDHFSSY